MKSRPFQLYLLWCLVLLLCAGWADHRGYTMFSDDAVESGGSGGSGGGGGGVGGRGPVHK
jgi:hypothetical protein